MSSHHPQNEDEPQYKGHTKSANQFVIAQMVALVSGLGVQSIAAHQLANEEYARFTIVHSMLLLSNCLLCGIIPRIAARKVSIEPNTLRGILTSLSWCHLLFCTIFAGALVLFRHNIGRFTGDAQLSVLVINASVLIFIQCGVVEPCWYLLNGLKRHSAQATYIAIHGILRCVLVCLFVLYSPTASSAVWGIVWTSALSAFLAGHKIVRVYVKSPYHQSDDRIPLAELWSWTKYSTLVDVSLYAGVASNLWLVKSRIHDEKIVASFAVCYVLAQTNLAIFRAISRGFFSNFARACSNQHQQQCREILASATRLMITFVSLELAVMYCIGPAFIKWFSGIEIDSRELPVLLLSATAATGIIIVFSEFLVAASKIRTRFVVSILFAVLITLLNSLVINSYGLRGVCFAFLAGSLITLTVLISLCVRIFGSWNAWYSLARCSAAAATSLLICLVVMEPPQGLVQILLVTAMLVSLYLTLLLVIGEITFGELLIAVSYLNRKFSRFNPAKADIETQLIAEPVDTDSLRTKPLGTTTGFPTTSEKL